MRNLKDKNVVVTGGNRGIGEAIALAFAKEGANIIITYHSDSILADKVINKLLLLDVKAKKIKMDVKDSNARSLLLTLCDEFGDIDILVNNAGIATRNSFLTLSEAELRNVMEVNFMAPYFLIQAFANQMVAKQLKRVNHKKTLKDYCIINITSISETVITDGLSHYEASKAALTQLTKSISNDLAKYGIRANNISPGHVPTDINRQFREKNKSLWEERISCAPLNRAGNPDEVASCVVFAASNRWMTGSTLVIDGGRSNSWEGQSLSQVMEGGQI